MNKKVNVHHYRRKKMKKVFVITAAIMAMGFSQAAMAGGDHMNGDHHAGAMDQHGHMHDEMHGKMKGAMHGDMKEQMSTMEMNKEQMFLQKKDIDGYQVSFHIMKAPEGIQQHGGTHHLMFKAEKDGKILTDLTVNSKVTHPNGKSESKMMMKMGDWYMAGYDLDHSGQHKLMVLFKTADGQKHFGGILYPQKTRSKS